MSHPIPPPEEEQVPLPDLNMAQLDEAGLEALLGDIEKCVEILEILPKFGAQDLVPESAEKLTLAEARAMLRERKVRGLQLRYRYDGVVWWDTLMIRGTGWRLVRIRQAW